MILTHRFLFVILVAWFLIVIYKCTPHRWTSFNRVVCETSYRLGMPLLVFNPYASIDGTLPYCDEINLPVESAPPVVYIGKGEPVEVSVQTLSAAASSRDVIVVWKNFIQDKLDNYKNITFVKQNFKNDTYFFLTNFTNWKLKEIGLIDALDVMDHLYLGFSYTVLDRNPRLWQDVNSVLQSYGPKLQSMIPVNFSKHHAFMYQGKGYHTGLHQAPLSDWFLQVANTKRWTFIEPKYTPYMRSITEDGISMMSQYDFIHNDTRIPHIDVYTEPGDLMYFPPHWWHEVHNIDEGFGLAFGFRPKIDVLRAPMEFIFPFTTNPGEYSHRVLFFASVFKNIATTIWNSKNLQNIPSIWNPNSKTTHNSDSGLLSRESKICQIAEKIRKYRPTWSWDKFAPPNSPVCPNIAKKLSVDSSGPIDSSRQISEKSTEL